MKNKLHFQHCLALAAMAVFMLLPGLGWGQSLLVDDFTGLTVGANLAGQSGWTKFGSGPDATIGNATALTYANYNGGGAEYVIMPTGASTTSKVYKAFGSTPAPGTNTFYYSILLRLTATTVSSVNYCMSLGDPAPGTTYFARLFAQTNGAGFNIGISKLSNTAIYGSTVFNLNQTYLIVVRYDFVTGTTNDLIYVWVNPSLVTEPSTSSAEATNSSGNDANPATVGNFLWHYRGITAPVGSFDGVRVAYGATSAEAWTNLAAYASGSNPPATQASEISFSTVTSSGMTATWTNGDGGNRAVFMKQASTGTASPVNNTTYTASTTFGLGTQISNTGWYCVFNGPGNTVTVTGLTPSTIYSVMVCEYNGAAGAEQYNTSTAADNPNTVTTLALTAPILTATTLNGFGNVCISATGGPESFTINGTNLTADNVSVAALDGYTYSTSSGGPFTSTLSLSQPGGTYSQLVYVMFSPTLVQSYNGNIAIGGGGAASINVAVTGSGINTLPTVTTITPATSVNEFGATCSGDVAAAGCQPVTGRGICYGISFGPTIAGDHSTETGSTGSFSSIITGLIPYTTYHFRAYATSTAGTSYGTDQTFVTLNLSAPVATVATNVSPTGFTANWSAVPGATGYYLDVYTSSAGTFATDLFISEYVEGSSNNKYLEIFNGTVSSRNLADYKLQLFTNGSLTVSTDVVLSGTLQSGQTIVYKNSSAVLYTGTAYDNSAVNFNGNDAVAIYKISTASYTDIFGTIGQDPGASGWVNGSYSTFDKTLVRKATVTGGVTANPLPGFPTLATEWDLYNIDDITHLGSHTFSGAANTYVLNNDDVGNVTTYNVPGLTPGTLYHYVVRAYYQTASSSSSNVIDVSTAPAAQLTVTTEAPTAITVSTATGNGTIIGIGNSTPTTRGFCWDLAANPDPDINDFKVEETGSFGIGPFTGSITLLTGNTSYKVRAYATNAEGTSYGAVQTFTTMKAEPTNQATDFTAGTPTTTTIPLTWTDATGPVLPDAYLIKGSAVSYAAIVDPVDGTPEANSLLVQNVNQGLGAYTFIGLTPGAPYFFKIYSYTNSGTSIDYKLGTVPTATATTVSLPSGNLLYEGFDYPAGEYIGGNGDAGSSSNNWTTHSVTAGQTTTVDIISGNLSYTGLAAPTGNKVYFFSNANATSRDVNRAFTPTGSPTVMYYSALINIINNEQLTTSFDYFLSFGGTSGISVISLFGRLHIKSVNAGANFHLGIQNISGTGASQTEYTTDLDFGSTYLIVVKYDFNGAGNDIASLWVNPGSLGGAEPAGAITNSGSTSQPPAFASICLRNNLVSPKAEIDEIRVGTSWADVTPPGIITKTLNLKLYLEGLYNTVTGSMKQAMGAGSLPQFGTGIADQVTVELHETTPPYAISALYPPFTNADLKTDGTVTINTIPGDIAGSYYVVIKHRNSIETWSSAPVSFTGAGPFTYDFTTAVTQAFGNDPINDPSMKLMDGVYAIWGGNVNQDGIDDGSDMLLIDNASLPPGLQGYNPEDLNGDGIVDGTDMALIDNNSKPPARHIQKP